MAYANLDARGIFPNLDKTCQIILVLSWLPDRVIVFKIIPSFASDLAIDRLQK